MSLRKNIAKVFVVVGATLSAWSIGDSIRIEIKEAQIERTYSDTSTEYKRAYAICDQEMNNANKFGYGGMASLGLAGLILLRRKNMNKAFSATPSVLHLG